MEEKLRKQIQRKFGDKALRLPATTAGTLFSQEGLRRLGLLCVGGALTHVRALTALSSCRAQGQRMRSSCSTLSNIKLGSSRGFTTSFVAPFASCGCDLTQHLKHSDGKSCFKTRPRPASCHIAPSFEGVSLIAI